MKGETESNEALSEWEEGPNNVFLPERGCGLRKRRQHEWTCGQPREISVSFIEQFDVSGVNRHETGLFLGKRCRSLGPWSLTPGVHSSLVLS